MKMVDVATYALWQKADQTSLELKQLRDALARAEFANNPTFRYELEQIKPKIREDSTTLSEKRRLELTELLVGYKEPIMDRFQHDTYLQYHRKYLERLASFRRRDAIIQGVSPKGINAEEMARYSFAHAARGLGNHAPGTSLACNKGLDPQTGKYSMILKYEGSLEVRTFKSFIRRYSSSQKIDLYETLKALFNAGQDYGLTKKQLAEVLINILETREVRESSDTLEANIYKQKLMEDAHETIADIIQMVSRNTQQAIEVRERIARYRRPKGLPIANCINTLSTLCEEFFRHSHPGMTIFARRQKVEQSIVKMLPDIVDPDIASQLKRHKNENNNNGVENSLDNLRNFLSKVEGDRNHVGGQRLSRDGMSMVSFFNSERKKGERSRPVRKEKRRGRYSRRSSTEDSRGSKPADSISRSTSASRAASASSSRGTSRSPTRTIGTSTETSRASSVHSTFSEPRIRKKETDSRRKKKDPIKKRKKEKAHYSSKERRPRPRPQDTAKKCPICYEDSCPNIGLKRCPSRPELVYNPRKNGCCMVCKKGYHFTVGECMKRSEKEAQRARQEEDRGSRERGPSPSKN